MTKAFPDHSLSAGPVRLTLADGELRHLFVNEREIVRRIYFAVRFGPKWDTAPNQVTACEVRAADDHFEVSVRARCRVGPVDYAWTATVTGATDGAIRFEVSGAAVSGCHDVRRTGIQVLLGTPDVVGCAYTFTGISGDSAIGFLPARLLPDNLPAAYREASYQHPDGLGVALEFSGTVFGVEDQRNFNESSFKLFSEHAHTYPELPAGQTATARVQMSVARTPSPAKAAPLGVRVSRRRDAAKLPRIYESDPATPHVLFYRLNHDAATRAAMAPHFRWAYTPAINLYDDVTFMDNVTAIADQVLTARAWAPGAVTTCVDPIHFDSIHSRPVRDARNDGAFGAAWTVALVKWLAVAGVDSAGFRVGPGPALSLREVLARSAGQPLCPMEITGQRPWPVDAFTLESAGGAATFWFVNLTDAALTLPVEGLPAGRFEVRRNSGSEYWERAAEFHLSPDESLRLELSAYEVCRLSPS